MAKKSRTKTAAKKTASSPAKSSGKAKGAKSRAAPLLIGVAKKTTPARPPLTKSRPAKRRTPATAKPLPAMEQEKVDAGQGDQFHLQKNGDASTASMKQPPEERMSVDGKAEDLPAKGAMAQETRKLFEQLRETMGAVPPPVSAGLAFSPIGMMVRNYAYGFNFVLDALQMQRRFFDTWQPRPR